MSKFAEPMTRLIDELKKLPGIGAKTAQRLAFHILRSTDDDAEALAAAVRDVKASSAPLLHLQQHHRRRPLRLLREPDPQPAPGLRS